MIRLVLMEIGSSGILSTSIISKYYPRDSYSTLVPDKVTFLTAVRNHS